VIFQQSIFPLVGSIFYFLKKKIKGYTPPSGLVEKPFVPKFRDLKRRSPYLSKNVVDILTGFKNLLGI